MDKLPLQEKPDMDDIEKMILLSNIEHSLRKACCRQKIRLILDLRMTPSILGRGFFFVFSFLVLGSNPGPHAC
jgi:hypothetical protein